MNHIAVILGTRPEIIKLASVVHALRTESKLEPVIISTGQHREIAELAFKSFSLCPDVDLGLMKDDQMPLSFLGTAIIKLESLLEQLDVIGTIVQGDTTSALAGALASFHLKLPIAHVEAGLRTHLADTPFPEEMNRSLIARLASIHFAPTESAATNLRNEGIKDNIYVCGNSVVDTALWMKNKLEDSPELVDEYLESLCEKYDQLILVTGHRREHFHEPIIELCNCLKSIRDLKPNVGIIYPVHPNPNIKNPVSHELSNEERIHLVDPVSYPDLLYLISKSKLIITDSGGIQEEAPSFGVPVIVTRESTERIEAITEGFARLIPLSSPKELVGAAVSFLDSGLQTEAVANPFGDGTTSSQIAKVLTEYFSDLD